jgi:hypothetical protein
LARHAVRDSQRNDLAAFSHRSDARRALAEAPPRSSRRRVRALIAGISDERAIAR